MRSDRTGENKETRIRVDRLLLISGAGRNSGKTAIACEILNRFSAHHSIIGLKISSHDHSPGSDLRLIHESEKYALYEEQDRHSGKDSSRMMNAGAIRSYLLQSNPKGLGEAIQTFLGMIEKDILIICESPSLHEHVIPGIFIFAQADVENPKPVHPTIASQADLSVKFSGPFSDRGLSGIQVYKNRWIMNREEME